MTRARRRRAPVHDGPMPRRGLPWSPAEDAYLLRRVRELEADETVDSTLQVIARELGRGSLAVQTRFCAIRAGLRLAALSNLKAATP